MLTLTAFPGTPTEPSMSCFCTKAMLLLQIAGQDWRPRFVADTRAAPFGKLPMVQTPGGVIGDSNRLLDWLQQQGADLFPGMDSAARAQAHAVIRMAEENLRYGMVHERWVDPEGWAAFAPVAFADMPAPLRLILPGKIRKAIAQGLKWQGLGRFDPETRHAYFQADLDALTDMLWQDAWLFGDQPSAVDAAVLPILSSIESLQTDSRLRRAVRANMVLMRYVTRGREALYAPLTSSISAAA